MAGLSDAAGGRGRYSGREPMGQMPGVRRLLTGPLDDRVAPSEHLQVSKPPGEGYIVPMNPLAAPVLAAFLATVAAGPALAQFTHFIQVEKIRLPNGEMGEARLLKGDGIIGPDPVRVLLLNSQHRLLARSHKSLLMALSCEADGRCLIFDLSNSKILDQEPGSFRQGERIPDLGSRSDVMWDLEQDEESWGFAPRTPTLRERLKSYAALVRETLVGLVFDGLVGIAVAQMIAGIRFIAGTKRTERLDTVAAVIAVVSITVWLVFLLLISALLSHMGGLPVRIWLMSQALGAGLFYVGYRLRNAVRSRFIAREGAIP